VSAAGDVTGTITVAARSGHTKNKRRDAHLPGPQRGPPDPGLPAGRTLAPLDENAGHARGSPAGRLIIEYGDYECPYSRQAFHAIEQVEQQLGRNVRFAFRHFPLTRIHPHALAAALRPARRPLAERYAEALRAVLRTAASGEGW
jgi:DSBA-like thioredoxin domain